MKIKIEGPQGCGKTSVAEVIANALYEKGWSTDKDGYTVVINDGPDSYTVLGLATISETQTTAPSPPVPPPGFEGATHYPWPTPYQFAVTGHGKTLAIFSDRGVAECFAGRHGGHVIATEWHGPAPAIPAVVKHPDRIEIDVIVAGRYRVQKTDDRGDVAFSVECDGKSLNCVLALVLGGAG